MKKLILFIFFISMMHESYSQGFNHEWLFESASANYLLYPKARMDFDSTTYSFQTEFRKMVFNGTEATLCDANGNFLMSSNGVWIANANNDTMLNGGGLNPGPEVTGYPHGLLLIYANIFLPYPGDSSKVALIHHAADVNGISYSAMEVFITLIDKTLDNGLGGVISKNNLIYSDTLNQGIVACKHANGRDWWVIVQQHNTDTIFKMLFTPDGISSISSQKLNVPVAWFNVTQMCFSNNGDKFSYYAYDSITLNESVFLFDFDRCSGLFSNTRIIPVTINQYLWGLSFSPTAKYLYACSSTTIYQIDTDSLTVQAVASWDGFYSGAPPTCCATTFFNIYLAGNGKIYITSGNGVHHLHQMNYPDSAGITCDIQQHAINLGVWYFRAVPNHPNYYLGPVVGSICDSLTGIDEHLNEISNFSIRPNPNNGDFSISYLLPEGQPGWFEVYDILGKQIYRMPLPPWSTLQKVILPKLTDGIYNALVYCGGHRASKKIAIINESYK